MSQLLQVKKVEPDRVLVAQQGADGLRQVPPPPPQGPSSGLAGF